MRNILENLDTRSGAKYEHIHFEERLKIGSRILIERDNENSTDSMRVNSKLKLNSKFLILIFF